MKLSIIVIGDEILLGQVTDTNSGEIARTLGPMGWEITGTLVIGDDRRTIIQTIDQALRHNDLVITTGGLGPTKDDITKAAMTEYFGGGLIKDMSVVENIREVFEKRGLKLNPLTEAQALVPSSCEVIQNKLGTAPIMWFEHKGKVLIAMPGVPFETAGMLHDSVAEKIKEHFTSGQTIMHHTFMVSDITESDLAIMLNDWESGLPGHLHLAYLPTPGLIRLRIDGISPDKDFITDEMDRASKELRDILGSLIIHDGDAAPAEILLGQLSRLRLSVSTAESCTGGNIARCITSVSGSSVSYMGSVVSYSNDVKMHLLGVRDDDLGLYGAVSRPVVEQMAEGVSHAVSTDCAIATSGIAGPGGGTADKPVGTVWIAVKSPSGIISRQFHFPGDRSRVIDRASTTAILMLVKELRKL